jgi:hypothetical protein
MFSQRFKIFFFSIHFVLSHQSPSAVIHHHSDRIDQRKLTISRDSTPYSKRTHTGSTVKVHRLRRSASGVRGSSTDRVN